MAQTGDFRLFILEFSITFPILSPSFCYILLLVFLELCFFLFPFLSFFFFRGEEFFFFLSCRRGIPIVWYERKIGHRPDWPSDLRCAAAAAASGLFFFGLGLAGCRRPEVSSVVETPDQSWRGRSKDVIAKRFPNYRLFSHTWVKKWGQLRPHYDRGG